MFEFLSRFKRQNVDSTRILVLEMDVANLRKRVESLEIRPQQNVRNIINEYTCDKCKQENRAYGVYDTITYSNNESRFV